ncbi:MAG: exosortase [Acidobacteria bacterium]|nr:MAG: exosortase [Acidobacteriota bacterium]
MIGIGAWVFSAGLLYAGVLLKLVQQWAADPTYSHGFVVAPIALFLVWQQRDRLRRTTSRPSGFGLVVIVVSLAIYVLGSLGAELFLTRISLLGVVAGTVLYVFGSQYLRVLAFPLAFLVFMIPLPAIVFDRATVSLQLVASRMGEELLRAADVPVLRDGNILTLPAITLEVNDACSGIRSLMALLSVAALVGYFSDVPPWQRVLLTCAALPIAIVLNGVRIAATGLAASRFGPVAASGAIHATSGWIVFMLALAAVWLLEKTLGSRVRRAARRRLETA